MQLNRKQRKLLRQPIATIGLSVRTTNALDSIGILTVQDLLSCCPRSKAECTMECVCDLQDVGEPRAYLLDTPNFGNKTLTEVFSCLGKHGFCRNGKEDKDGVLRSS